MIVFTYRRRWRLCRDSRTKRNSAVQCGTQKCRSKPYQLLPLDCFSSAVPSFQLHPVFGAISNRVPPSNTMSCSIAFGDKSWDNFKNLP